MKLLASFLSVVFGLLGILVLIFISLQNRNFDAFIFLGILLVSAFPLWLSFWLLDRLYRKLHPQIFETSWGGYAPHPGFSFIQAIISALRSTAFNLAVPAVSLALIFVFLVLPFYLAHQVEETTLQILIFVALSMLMIALLGTLVQRRYKRSVLSFMMEKSSKRAAKQSQKKMSTKAGKLDLRLLDEKKKIKLSKPAAKKQSAANRIKRLFWLRDVGAPLVAVFGILAIALVLQLDTFQQSEYAIGLLIGWLILFVLGYLGTKMRISDRSPFRQFRLGFGMILQAFLLTLFSPVSLLFELAGRKGQPQRQWMIIPRTGSWVSQLLRSQRFFWFPAILLASMFPLLKSTGSLNLSSPALIEWAIYLMTGILAFEMVYRLFDRILKSQHRKSNRLVFLRVFGDPGRGRFLFRHLVPHWRGLGNITCIAAPDVSIHQLQADLGFALLFAGLRQRFLGRDESQVIGRHINSEAPGTVIEDHCFDDTWMSAVNSLLTQNAIVLMDLRGFTAQRKGCIYELGVLRDHISMGSVVFLIDDTTDADFLEKTLHQLWKNIYVHSPNTKSGSLGSEKQRRVTIFRMANSKNKSAQELVKLLLEATVMTEAHHQSHGQLLLNQLIDDLQLLAADAAAQVKAVGGGRWPGEKVLEAGFSSDHDLGNSHYLSSWGLINDQQYHAISDVNDAVQEIRINSKKRTESVMKEDPDWQELRAAAQNCLTALGKRRRAPKSAR